MRFEKLALADLEGDAGLRIAFFNFFREMVAEISSVELSSVRITDVHSLSRGSEGRVEVTAQVQYPALVSEWPEGAGSGRFLAEGSAALELEKDLPLALLIVLASDLSARLGKPSVEGSVRLPESGWFSDPSGHGWFKPEELEAFWSDEPDIVNAVVIEEDADAEDDVAAAEQEELADLLAAITAVSAPLPSPPPPPLSLAPPVPPPPVVVVIMEEPQEEIAPVEADTTPPECELLPTESGQLALVDIDMFAVEFADPGVKCYDKGDVLPASQITKQIEFFNGESWSPAREINSRIAPTTFRIIYDAADEAGNLVQTFRTVRVLDPCTRSEPPEEICVAESNHARNSGVLGAVCSVTVNSGQKICDRDLLASMAGPIDEPVVVEEPLAADTKAPNLVLNRGDGVDGLLDTSEGRISVIIHTYMVSPQANRWLDPGYEVSDDRDSSDAVKVVKDGAAAITTAFPTMPGRPFQIKYWAIDSSLNQSPVLRRLVYVDCPPGEVICDTEADLTNLEPEHLSCSTTFKGQQVCGDDAQASLAGLGEYVAAETLRSIGLEPEATDPPQLHCGPESISIQQYQVYARCTEGSRADEACDPGCTAEDAQGGDGDLTHLVEACTKIGGPKRLFSDFGVSNCGVDTSIAGQYKVEFCVQSSRGPDSRICVSRTVSVTPACPSEEILCKDTLECSLDGVCPIDLLGGVLKAEAASVISTSEEDAKREASPPKLQLLGVNAVAVKRGTEYRKCGPRDLDASQPGAAQCDEGAVATDIDWDGNEVDITAKVLVCPPSSCLAQGCPGHEFASSAKGDPGQKLKCAVIDEMAAVGTTFELRFYVRDLTGETESSNATRTVTIVEPCQEGEQFCEEDRSCSEVDCSLRESLGIIDGATEEVPAPTVKLLPEGTAVLRVAYGSVPPFGLGFCSSLQEAQQKTCGAAAYGGPAGALIANADSLSVESILNCGGDGACQACLPEAAMSGSCGPGRYLLEYQAYDSSGQASNKAMRILIVEERAEIRQAITLAIPGVTLMEDAEIIAETLRSDQAALTRLRGAFVLSANSSEIRNETVSLPDVAVKEAIRASRPSFSLEFSFLITLASSALSQTSSGASEVEAAGQQRRLLSDSVSLVPLKDQMSGVVSALGEMGGESFLEAVQGEQLPDSLESVSLEGIGQPTLGNATPPVDELAALLSTLGSTMVVLQQSNQAASGRLGETLSVAERSLVLAAEPTTDADISKPLKSLLSYAAEVFQEQETGIVAAAAAFDRVLRLQAEQQNALSSTVQSLEEGIASSLYILRTLATMNAFSSDIGSEGHENSTCQRITDLGDGTFAFSVEQPRPQGESRSSSGNAARRKLLGRGGGGGPSSSGRSRWPTSTTEYMGYQVVFPGDVGLTNAAIDRPIGLDDRPLPLYVGTSGNRVLGGVLLHQTRTSNDIEALCMARQSLPGTRRVEDLNLKLSYWCEKRRYLQEYGGEHVLQSVQESNLRTLEPFGLNPHWNWRSRLFRPSLAGATADYYNPAEVRTDGADVPNEYHFIPLPGEEDGFPVYVDSMLTWHQAVQMLIYLDDSGYMTGRTKDLSMRMAVYNPKMRVFGYARTDVTRDSVSGLFTLSTKAAALPALHFDWSTTSGMLAVLRENLLSLLLVVYIVYFFWELHANRRMRAKDRILLSAFDFVVLIAMLLGTIVDYTQKGIALQFSAEPFYDVYDSPSVSARPLLISRNDTNISVPDFEFAGNSSLRSDWASLRGGPGRWELPENSTQMDAFAKLLAELQRLENQTAVIYTLQALIIVGLIFNNLMMYKFQSRFGVIIRTFIYVLPDMGEFLLVIIILVVMVAVAGIVILGEITPLYSTMSEALYTLCLLILVGDDGGIPALIGGDNGWDLSNVEAWSIYLYFVFVTIFFVFVMVNFFFGFVSDTMANQQSLTADGKMVNEEVSGMLIHEFQTIFLRAPTNDAIADIIEDEFERRGVEYRLPLTVEEEVALINETANICRSVMRATEEVMDMISYCNGLVEEMETSSRELCGIAKQLGDTRRMQPFRGTPKSNKSRFNASLFASAASRFSNGKPRPSTFSYGIPKSSISNLRAEPAKNKGRKKAIIDLSALIAVLGLFRRRGKAKRRHETLLDALVAESSDLPRSKQQEMWQEMERYNRLRGRFHNLLPGNNTSRRRWRMGLHKASLQGVDDSTVISQTFINHLNLAASPGDSRLRSSIFKSTAPVAGSAPTLPGEPLLGNSNPGAVSEGAEHCWAWPRINFSTGEDPAESSAGHSSHEDCSIRLEPALPLMRTSLS